MDWLILIVFVPLLLVAIVALCGFAGCGINFVATGVRPAPTDLVATATGTHSIKVTWLDHGGGVTAFDIAHAKLGGIFATVGADVVSVRQEFDDVNLDDGTTYVYQLVQFGAVVADGGTATTIPEAPTILNAKGIDIDRIRIRWQNNSAKADRFILQHRSPPTGPFSKIFEGGALEFSHTVPQAGPMGGDAHEYRVIATVGGFDKNVPKLVESVPSAAVIATPLTWKVGYDHHPVTEVRIEDFRNACMVQRIKRDGNLVNGGIKVRITLEGAKSGNIAIVRMSISQAKVVFAPTGPDNEWDSEGTPTPVPLVGFPAPAPLPGIPGGILLAADTSIVLNPVVYDLDPLKDLIVAFDIGSAAGTAAFAVVPGTKLFFRATTEQALLADRSSTPPFVPAPADRVYLVSQIDVLG